MVRLTSKRIFPRREKVHLYLSQKDGSKGVILNLSDFYFFFHSLYNLVNFCRLNNQNIYHDNEKEILYHIKIRKIFA